MKDIKKGDNLIFEYLTPGKKSKRRKQLVVVTDMNLSKGVFTIDHHFVFDFAGKHVPKFDHEDHNPSYKVRRPTNSESVMFAIKSLSYDLLDSFDENTKNFTEVLDVLDKIALMQQEYYNERMDEKGG